MKCPKCHSEIRIGMKFCEQCGAKLERQCPSCKANDPRDPFANRALTRTVPAVLFEPTESHGFTKPGKRPTEERR